MEAWRTRVIEEARGWLRTPFHDRARLRGIGVDCGTLLAEVYSASGFGLIDWTEEFTRDWHLHSGAERYLEIISRFAAEVAEPLPGDLVLFRFGRTFSHAGIVEEWPGKLIHAYWRTGVEYTDAGKQPLAGRPLKFFSPIIHELIQPEISDQFQSE